ncbi:hypothetical protein LEP1GSC145_3536 [Leptospira interrogans serovar Djasiman str. LT1649]|nr:hypothetical protein LEP1GSC045_1075 [Leptospira interrogans serovar Pomona str. Kennewicki LC82-25]EKN96996.1 hypothetical protein LEP1GSC014_4155 [Leptospira interrogans serovar Pomona str. Pomona]EKO69576.1 hypothetical protein LEP1GSC069_0429 [Leptospira interrogans serovar Canicola str. Fiocruz LV133]EKR36475.1 hypothetical protein LEP1GSC096_0671 [Leptospira interrogans serovar Hebdomadis str. R499]EMF34442.1 hypothetical protein LEP1GSC201_1383 [Leptospira interrogans serovar Pomona s
MFEQSLDLNQVSYLKIFFGLELPLYDAFFKNWNLQFDF